MFLGFNGWSAIVLAWGAGIVGMHGVSHDIVWRNTIADNINFTMENAPIGVSYERNRCREFGVHKVPRASVFFHTGGMPIAVDIRFAPIDRIVENESGGSHISWNAPHNFRSGAAHEDTLRVYFITSSLACPREPSAGLPRLVASPC